MDATDFGVDLTTLPKLVLNEDAGRKMFERFLTVKTFRVGLNLRKEAYFRHYLADHLDVKAADWENTVDLPDWKKRIDVLKRDHELVWNSINDIVNRHTFLIITAWASFGDNILNENDRSITQCNAYRNAISTMINSAVDSDEMAAWFVRELNKHDAMNSIETAIVLAGKVDDSTSRYRNQMMQFIKDAADMENYADGMPTHKRH